MLTGRYHHERPQEVSAWIDEETKASPVIDDYEAFGKL
jgi:hypothetical protein